MKCQALTKAGWGCHHRAKEGLVMCGKHELKEHAQCIGLNDNGKRCMKVGPLCNKHRAEQKVIHDMQFAEAMWDRLMDDYEEGGITLDEIEDRIIFSANAGGLTPEWRDRLLDRVRMEREEAEYFAQHHEREVPFHEDNQNVHRAIISEQTNRGMEILLAQDTRFMGPVLSEIWAAWGDDVPKALKDDMYNWCNQPSCRKPYDFLYRDALRGLWSIIKGHKDKAELINRLAEECDEAFGMCCEGHLCRLVNVMVGFDERFEVQVSKKEQLQQKMAEISMREVSTEQKALEAWKWMEENGIPEEERNAWIDAF